MTTGHNDVRDDSSRRRPAPQSNPDAPTSKADVMQAALQVDAYTKSSEQGAHLLQLADNADPSMSVTQGSGRADVEDTHDYDDVVQQSFPASDPPPPR